jgi:predicted flap endonuclease-1-like 5' DNA nuclease
MTTCDCEEDRSFPYLAFLPVIAGLFGLLVIILRSRRGEIRLEEQEELEGRKSIRLPSTQMQPEASKPDNLTRIEGIGPKTLIVLNRAGIQNFSQIAALKPKALKEILVNSGNRASDPSTWPEQARLAAKGKWDELKTLQATLKGGRRA